MYSLVTYQPGQSCGCVLCNLSLCQAWQQLQQFGRGAIFRGAPGKYASPIYPKLISRR